MEPLGESTFSHHSLPVMRKLIPLCLIGLFSLSLWLFVACGGGTTQKRKNPTMVSGPTYSMKGILRSVNYQKNLIPPGTRSRRKMRPMRPRYITIHSTQNYRPGAGAYTHMLALNRGKLGVSWHFTVDDKLTIQHLPTNEQGVHADFDGPGNKYSIGIEMCENRGNNRTITIDKTARLTAFLMHRYRIPLKNVVPHYHWPRYGKRPPNKNCPHFLLDGGRPGPRWAQFKRKVNRYYRSISR
ncbi:MAG: peptidoglycan recognition family protein [Verrucomicrobiota bacterium]